MWSRFSPCALSAGLLVVLLLVGGNSASAQGLAVEVYSVGDLTPQGDTDSLAELCTSLIAPTSWEDVGGEASLSFLKGKMTVRQTPEAHKTVASLLAALRKVPRFKAPVRAAPRTTQIPVGRKPEDDDKSLRIVVYPVADLLSRNKVDFDTIIEHLTTTIEPTSWDEVGGPGAIGAFSDRGLLVISNTGDAHKQIIGIFTKSRQPKKRPK
ncbi:MAG: hypothetical protein HQ567_02200 [Candidatus Nealsonbacteria bacterium]|nr:hypothetical protein [Candidatus Nealsonbacteria bacterium]